MAIVRSCPYYDGRDPRFRYVFVGYLALQRAFSVAVATR